MFPKRGIPFTFTIMFIIILMLGAVGPVKALPACTDAIGCVELDPDDPIHIAYALDETGGASALGIDERNGIQIAIDDSSGQILGHDIQFDGEDSQCSQTGGATTATTLAADATIVAVIGTTCSSAAHGAMPILSSAGLVMISPSNTATDLTEAGNPNNYPGYLRTAWPDKIQGEAAAHFALEYLGVTKAATIKDANPYGGFLEQAFVDEFISLGGTITSQQTVDSGDESSMAAALTTIAGGEPQLVYFPLFTPAGTYIINQARATAGLENAYLMGPDSLYTQEIVDNAGANAEGFLVSNADFPFLNDNPQYTDVFLPAYIAKFGNPTGTFHAHAYDAFMLIKAAIESVAVQDPDGSLQIGRQALRDALYGTTDFAGLTGTLKCSATGDCGDPHMAVYEYHASQFPPTYIWPDFVPLSITSSGCDNGSLIHSVEATDRYTVTFGLCRPDSAFLPRLAIAPFAIYPQKWLEATAGETNRTTQGLEKPVGTGPYKVDTWDKGTSLALMQNADYWGTVSETDTLVFNWSDDPSARLLALQNSTIDGYDLVAQADYATIQADPTLQLADREGLNTLYVGMNNTHTPYNNVLVRRAIGRAIDRQALVDDFYPNGTEIASHFTPCSIPNGCVGTDWYSYNPAGAKTLLTSAGYPDGFSTTLYYRAAVRTYLPQPAAIAQAIKEQLEANLGLTVTLNEMDSASFIYAVTSGNIDGLYLLGWVADYPHVSNFLDYHFGRQNIQFGNPYSQIYTPLEAAAQIADPATAAPYYTTANNAIRDLVPMVPVAHAGSAVAYRADVTNPQASPLGNDLFGISDPGGRDTFKWMQGYEPNSLFCADETDGESFRACAQIMQPLYTFQNNSSDIEPALAESCAPNGDLTTWTCTLRQNVKFHDGSLFDANDVVATFRMGLDVNSPTHKGNSNSWDYYNFIWGLWKDGTTTTITADTPDPSKPNQQVQVNVTVTGGSSTPTGDVDISGTDADCTITLAGGSGSCNVNFTSSGLKTITATYNGDGTHQGSSDTDIHKVVTTSTYRSSAAQDGWVLESAENSKIGGTLDAAATTLRLGDDATRKQYLGILSFNTAGLPDNAVITKVTLKVKKQGITGGGNPVTTFQGFKADIKKGTFGTSVLQLTDFQAAYNGRYGPFTLVPVSGWYSINLTGGKAYINKLAASGGLTQIRLYFKLDDNNNTVANYLSLYSGSAPFDSRPQLIIEYYVP